MCVVCVGTNKCKFFIFSSIEYAPIAATTNKGKAAPIPMFLIMMDVSVCAMLCKVANALFVLLLLLLLLHMLVLWLCLKNVRAGSISLKCLFSFSCNNEKVSHKACDRMHGSVGAWCVPVSTTSSVIKKVIAATKATSPTNCIVDVSESASIGRCHEWMVTKFSRDMTNFNLPHVLHFFRLVLWGVDVPPLLNMWYISFNQSDRSFIIWYHLSNVWLNNKNANDNIHHWSFFWCDWV